MLGDSGQFLGLPVQGPRVAVASFLIVLAVFLATMCVGVGFYDGPLLAMAAAQFGLAHPPGQPLWTLMAGASARLPGIDSLTGMNGLSALCGALTVFPAFSIAQRMLPEEARAQRGPTAAIASVIVIGALHSAVWEQSTRIEVYALAALIGLWSIARLAYLLDRQGGPVRAGHWLALGFALGLAASANPVLAIFSFLAGSTAVMVRLLRRQVNIRSIALVALGGLLGLAPYLYIPWVAQRQDVLVWGSPRTASALIAYLTARDFAANLSVSGVRWLEHLLEWFAWSSGVALLPVLVLGMTAHLVFPSRGLGRAAMPVALFVAVGYLARYTAFKPDVPDLVSYVSIATWLAIAGAAGLAGVLAGRGERVAAVGIVLVILGCALLAPPRLLSRTRSHDDVARKLARAMLEDAPRDAIVITSMDHWAATSMYLQEVENVRTDLVVLASGLMSSSWHWNRIYERHPTLTKVPLRGPGGALGRLQRFLQANAERPLRVENAEIAAELGLSLCIGRWFLASSEGCARGAEVLGAAAWLSAAVGQIDEGEPTTLGALASVAEQRGMLLWRQGDGTAALATFLSTVPPSWGIATTPFPDARGAPPLRVALPPWSREAPLGDPAQTLFLAAQIAYRVGSTAQAQAWVQIAAAHGLPEAEGWLAEMKAGSAARGGAPP